MAHRDQDTFTLHELNIWRKAQRVAENHSADRHTIRLVDPEDGYSQGKCPKCGSHQGFRFITGKRGGWECLHCGLLFPHNTWEQQEGTLKRRHKKTPKRKTYVDRKAWNAKATSSGESNRGTSDEVPELPSITETGLTLEEFDAL